MVYKKLEVVEKTKLNERFFTISFRDGKICNPAIPGQFCQIKDVSQTYPILPRPFSMYHVKNDQFSFLIKLVGESTMNLSQKSGG